MQMKKAAGDLISRGFLPDKDPLARLPAEFKGWDRLAYELPKLLTTTRIRSELAVLPKFPLAKLKTEAQLERAMMILSYLGHAYVWGEAVPTAQLPATLAVPWHAVAKKVGRPPVLSYPSYALHNWRRRDPRGPIAIGNIVLLQNFLGGIDEEWFILIHVDIEAKAGAAIAALQPAQQAAAAERAPALEAQLKLVSSALSAMYDTLSRMPELCDPYIYYNRVRPYIHGWKNNPALPDGLVYESVKDYGGKPQRFAGETGAQSAIIPSLDATLGVAHEDDPLRPYLLDMRNYMAPAQRAFIAALEQGPSVRAFVARHRGNTGLREAYNGCVTWVERFRSKHLEYAASYIFKQAQTSLANPTAVGTGSTPFMPYLKKHRDETSRHLIR
jgi:indoleamine 2,3-dioxygenase